MAKKEALAVGDKGPELLISATQDDSTEGLVKVRKGEETLHVHPTTVQAHRERGWKPIEADE